MELGRKRGEIGEKLRAGGNTASSAWRVKKAKELI